MANVNVLLSAGPLGMKLIFDHVLGLKTAADCHASLKENKIQSTPRNIEIILKRYREIYEARYRIYKRKNPSEEADDTKSYEPGDVMDRNIKSLQTVIDRAIQDEDFDTMDKAIKSQSNLAKSKHTINPSTEQKTDFNTLLLKNDIAVGFIMQIHQSYPDLNLKHHYLQYLEDI